MEPTPKETEQSSDIALVIFASRESLETCRKTFQAACIALPTGGRIEFLINGNLKLAASVAAFVSEETGLNYSCAVRVWSLNLGDKANAWNSYFHKIWNDEKLIFFIDGYVRPHVNSLQKLMESVNTKQASLGGTGVPTMGRSALKIKQQLLTLGGFHGNLCCIKGDVISELSHRGIRIPFGIYRVDSFVGAILSFSLNPKINEWDPSKIVVEPGATWDIDIKRWWLWSDVKAKLNQIERQLRGKAENAAVKYFFTKEYLQPELFPATCKELILEWSRCDSDGYKRFMRIHPMVKVAWNRYIQRHIEFSEENDIELLLSISAS